MGWTHLMEWVTGGITKNCFFTSILLGKLSKKKTGKKAVRLTAWVDPPSPEAVKIM